MKSIFRNSILFLLLVSGAAYAAGEIIESDTLGTNIVSNDSLHIHDKGTFLKSYSFDIGDISGQHSQSVDNPTTIILALSGGGARGLSTIGLLKAFEEKNISVTGIAGTSMGGIVGGLYACGYSPDELDSIASELDFANLFSNSPPRTSMFITKREGQEEHLLNIRFNNFEPIIPQALTAGQRLTSLLTELTAKANYFCGGDFSKLPIPFVTIATDIVTGEQIILRDGSLADAMRSTMAFPLAFTGLEQENRILMDGGMVTPVPVSLAKKMGDANGFVVAVNTASELASKDAIRTPIDIANQVTTIMTADKLKEQLALAHMVIEPQIADFSSSDFQYKDSLIQIGYSTGIALADSLIDLKRHFEREHFFKISEQVITGLNQEQEALLKERLAGAIFTKSVLNQLLKEHTRLWRLYQMDVTITEYKHPSSTLPLAEISISAKPSLRFSDLSLLFEGNTVFENHYLAQQLITADSLLTPEVLQSGLDKILGLYREKGFDLVSVEDSKLDFESSSLTIVINEGRIRRIDIENNRNTRDWYVRSYFPLKRGELYSTEKANNGIEHIYGTDLFDRVTVTAMPSPTGVIVNIRVEEKHNPQIRLGWHWHNEYESEEFIELLHDNIAGIGFEYLLHARYSERRRNYAFSLKADRILSSYITSRITTYRNELKRKIYVNDEATGDLRDEDKYGVKITLGQQIARLGSVSGSLVFEHTSYEEPLVSESFNLSKIEFVSVVENFDQLPYPTTGTKYLFKLELAGKIVGGDVEYTRIYTSYEAYLPFAPVINYHPRIAVGLSRSGLPPTERFYLGGLHSFIGFQTHQLAGDKMFIFSNELRLKLPYGFYLTGRVDMGEVYASTDQIKLRNLRSGAGVALSYDSPLGPFEVGYGIVNKDFEEVYLNLGLDF